MPPENWLIKSYHKCHENNYQNSMKWTCGNSKLDTLGHNDNGVGTPLSLCSWRVASLLKSQLEQGDELCYPVTAPSEAEDTEFAYFAMTPRV